MLGQKIVEAAPVDLRPSRIADLLDAMIRPLLEDDRETALILTTARNDLRTLGWNRFAAEVNRFARASLEGTVTLPRGSYGRYTRRAERLVRVVSVRRAGLQSWQGAGDRIQR